MKRRCINCKNFERRHNEYIGICRKYGLFAKDTLSGCEDKPSRAVKPGRKGNYNEHK